MNPIIKNGLFKGLLVIALGVYPALIFAATGKPSAPIYITSVKQFAVEPDAETEIQVRLDVSHYDSGVLTVALKPDDNIVLTETDNEHEFVIDTNTRQIDIPVKFYATRPGRSYLMMTVSMEDENFNVQAKSMGVVIDVGGEAMALEKQMLMDVETAASEQGVKAMPAEEHIY